MAGSSDKKLTVVVLGDVKDAQRALGQLDATTGTTQRSMSEKLGAIGSKMSAIGKGMSTHVTLPIVAALGVGVKKLSDTENAMAQTEAAVKSTGGAAGVSAQQIADMSDRLATLSGIDDDAIQSQENLLLTFKNIKNEGPDKLFDQASKAALDMGTAMAKAAGHAIPTSEDLRSTTLQLGKALNDPIKGITALTRVGVTFTDAQKEQIKTMAEAGDVAGAQKVILGELQSEFGGSAEAAGKTLSGQLSILKQNFELAAAGAAQVLLPALEGLGRMLSRLFSWFQNLSPGMQRMVGTLATVAASIGPVLIVGGKLVSAFGKVGQAFKVLTAVMNANPYLLLIGATIALVAFIVTHWTQIKEAAKKVVGWIRDHWNALVDWFKQLPGRIGAAVAGMWDGIRDAFRGVINWIIRKWNDFRIVLGGQRINLPFGMGFTIPTITLDTPNLPYFHSGGVFRAPTPGGEGLAVLRDRERVIPADQAGQIMELHSHVEIDGREVAHAVRRVQVALS